MKIPKLSLGLALLCATLSVAPLTAHAAPADLDTTFSGDGKVTTDLMGGIDRGLDVTVQSDGKILVVGESPDGTAAIVRYNSNGSLDTSFGSGGKAYVTAQYKATPARIRVLSDGRIVIGGYCLPPDDGLSVPGRRAAFFLARVNANGSYDSSFGDAKLFHIGSNSYGHDFAIQSNGKYVMVGNTGGTAYGDFIVARFNTDGSLDSTFGSGGYRVSDLGSTTDYAYGVTIQSNGAILVSGQVGSDLAVARYTSAGNLDTTFSGDGLSTIDFGYTTEYGTSLAVQSDGKIVVVGQVTSGSNGKMAIARLTTTGGIDTSFGPGLGYGTLNFGTANAYAGRVAIQSNGKIVVAGHYNKDFAVARLASNGAGDTTFSGDGFQTTNINGNDYANGLAIQSDGKIVVAGTSADDFSVVRYQGDAVSSTAVRRASGGHS